MSDSVIDDIIAEEQFEKSLKHKTTKVYAWGIQRARSIKVKQIVENIERNLKKKGPYPLDRLKTFMENYETYPEVRPLAQQVLPKVIEGESHTSKRLAAYNMLRRKMKDFQRQ